MKRISLLFVMVAFVCLLTANVLAAIEQWTAPALTPAPAQLPALGAPLTVDGELTEWANAASIPMRSRSYINYQVRSHKWKGPADLSLEFYWAWNADGLCMAAEVMDNDVHNDTTKYDDVWMQDCIFINIDSRQGEKFRTLPYDQGYTYWTVAPPMMDRPARCFFEAGKEDPSDRQFVAKQTAQGYTFEILVPWKALPGFSPTSGAKLALQVGIIDYDATDGKTPLPMSMFINGAREQGANPKELTEWILVEKATPGTDTDFGPQVALDMPTVVIDKKTLPVAAELGRLLSAQADSITLRALDAEGKVVTSSTKKLKPVQGIRQGYHQAKVSWSLANMNYGNYYTVQAVLNDKSGSPIGSTARPLLYLGNAVEKGIERLQQANISALSQTQPFKAAAYLGAAACLEKVKRAAEVGDTTWTANMARELEARFDVLADGKLDIPTSDMFDLLTLAADPTTQTVVEFPRENLGEVSFVCGSVPLGYVTVEKFATPDIAANFVSAEDEWMIKRRCEKTTLAGLPAYVRHQSLDGASSALKLLDPAKQVLLAELRSDDSEMIAIDLEQIDWAQVKAAVILPECPKAAKDTVTAWAKKAKIPLISFADAAKHETVLIAGKCQSPEVIEKLGKREIIARKLVQGFTALYIAKGDRVYIANSPSQAVAEKAISLVLTGAPVTPADVDFMRAELVKTLPEGNATPEEGMELYCGDLHMHTFYSDGNISPAGLMLQSMYVYHDFAVMTDHNTIDGALVAKKLLKKYGFAYAQIVGEEITTWGHFNAYPLKEFISQDQPVYDFIKSAHKQGAIIHWNHPGWPPSDWATEHLGNGYFETALDAWEHIPGGYDEKIKTGAMMPVIVGTTDTHNGTFAPPERTIIFAPSPQGEDVAEAIRCNHVVASAEMSGRQFYGCQKMLTLLRIALSDSKTLKDAKAQQIKEMLKNADLPGLLRASQPKAVKP